MPTPNLGMTEPTVGADLDTWGTELNTCLTTIDAVFSASSGTPVGIRQIGTTTNDDASTGNVGEHLSASVATGSAVNLISGGSNVNVTSLSLTAGDWDVSGAVIISNTSAPTGVNFASGWTNSTSATVPTLPDENFAQVSLGNAAQTGDISLPLGRKRYSLSGTTTVYLSARASYTGGQMVAYGKITARRVR